MGAVSLAQGVPYFLPPSGVAEAIHRAVEEGKVWFYGPPRGIEPLREKISERILEEEGIEYAPEEILVTAGALQGITAALSALFHPGEEIIIPTPTYFPFLHLPKALGLSPVYVPLKYEDEGDRGDWGLDIERISGAVTPKTKAILLCHPNNPTGTLYRRAELEELARIAEEKDLLVLWDEVYKYFIYGEDFPNLAEIFPKEKLIRFMSFSKAWSLSGLRIGYLVAHPSLVSLILPVHEMMVTASASLPAQYAALECLTHHPHLPKEEFRGILEKRKKIARDGLGHLSDFLEANDPGGAYYFFAKLKDGGDDVSFCEKLLRNAGVALVPGSTFGEGGKGYVRISFAASEGDIAEAFRRMERHFSQKPDIEEELAPIFEILPSVAGISSDSREIGEGDLFVAIEGTQFNGHDFIEEAISRGAKFIVGEKGLSGIDPTGVRAFWVSDSRKALGLLASRFHGEPSKKLKVIGVTGTDGKTTTAHLINQILNESGRSSEVLSTLTSGRFHVTTPSAEDIQKWLSEQVEKGREFSVLEVTSHGIDQERVAGVKFWGAVLTNVTPEHLDYHQTFENYREVKARIFGNAEVAVLNADDENFSYFKERSSGEIISYGLRSDADVTSTDLGNLSLPLPGEYNLYNALAAYATAYALGVGEREVRKALETFDPTFLEGRFQRIDLGQDFSVIIDFAHTPNALAQVLKLAAQNLSPGGRLISVFGCAGERDRKKRPQMGRIAVKTCDLTILTAEDPRHEDVKEIIDEIAKGCFEEGAHEGKNFVRIPDRREAIKFALKEASRADIVLILGKGHERSMAYGDAERPWSDRGVVEEILGARD